MKCAGIVLAACLFASAAVASAQSEFNPDTILAIMEKTAQYRMNQDTLNNKWVDGGTYFPGVMVVYQRTHKQKYLDAQTTWAKRYSWQPYLTALTTSGDNEACFQTYSEIYLLDTLAANAYMIQPADKNFANLFDKAPLPHKRWGWIDLMYMAAPGMVRVAKATHKPRYVDSMDVYWWNSSKYYYEPTDSLFYRDSTFFKTRSYWSRGNGWVFGSLARVIPFLPVNYPTRPKYIAQFQEFSAKLASIQQSNGLWTSDLLNPAKFPQKETSGSAFFCFGMAWGINAGILNRATYEPIVRKAWTALVGCLNSDGSLGWVQATGSAPAATVQGFNMPYSEGAFLLAANEMYKLVTTPTDGLAPRSHLESESVQTRKISGLPGERIAIPQGARGMEVYTLEGSRILSRDLDGVAGSIPSSDLGEFQGSRIVRFQYQ